MMKRKFSLDDKSEIPAKRTLLQPDRVIVHQSTLPLQTLASIKVAISLWQHHNIRYLSKDIGYEENNSDVSEMCSDEDGEYYSKSEHRASSYDLNSLRYKVEKDVKELPVPQAIQRMISNNISPVVNKMRQWIEYHHRRIFFQHKESRIVYHYLDEIIWKSDGEVDYIETARNMLTSLKVSEIEKYRLISTYCLEFEMKKNVSKEIFSYKYGTKVRFDAHPLLYYWQYYALGALDHLKGTYSSVENRMITMQGVDNIHALTYFWNRMNENGQVEMAAFLIREYGLKYQKIFLSLMSEVQQHNLFVDMAVEIVLNFAKESSYSQYVLSSWMFIRNFITEKQFVDIFIGIISLQDKCYDNNSYNLVSLRNIWKNTPEYLRKFAIEYEDRKIIHSLATLYRPAAAAAELLFEMLHDASAEVRLQTLITPPSQYRSNFYTYLIGCGKPSLLEGFLHLCCRDDNAVVELKDRIINLPETRKYCLSLCTEGKTEKLDEFLAVYLAPEQIYDFRIQLLTSNEGVNRCAHSFQYMKFDRLNKTIAHILPIQQEADEFRKRMIFSEAAIQEFRFSIPRGFLREVNYSIKSLLPSEDDVKKIKEILKQHYMSIPISSIFVSFRPEYWQEFLLWCLDSEENVNKYKLSLPFEDIFNDMLQKSTFIRYDDLLKNCKFRLGCYFEDLDRFLRWYFVTPEEVKKFKINRIFEYYKIGMINTLLKKKKDYFLHKVAKWFFCKDNQQIQKFKNQYPSCRISSSI